MIYNNEQNNVNELFNNDFGYKSDDAFYSNNSFDDNRTCERVGNGRSN